MATATALDKPLSFAQLNEKQQRCVTLIKSGENVMVTGPAGTGKSALLKYLLAEYPDMPVCASTGIAALNVNGCTLHSWAGLGIGDDTAEEIAKRLADRKNSVWYGMKQADRLAIDEVSMIDAELFDKLDRVLQLVRKSAKPFGGLQLILFGDFLQLPPVGKGGSVVRFAFESRAWTAARIHVFLLTQVMRQRDEEFANVLSRVRVGDTSEEVRVKLRPRINAADPDPKISPVTLATHNAIADEINVTKLAELPGDFVTWEASDTGSEFNVRTLDQNCIAPKILSLKPGAQVMLLRNIAPEEGLVNGSLGEVIEIRKSVWAGPIPVVQFTNGIVREIERQEWQIVRNKEVLASRLQIPLRPSWAISIHKCVAYGTRIPVQGRGLIPIEDAVPGDWIDTGTGEFARLIATAHSEKPLIRMRTKRGFSVVTTKEHRWLCNGEMRETGTIRVGDRLTLMPPTIVGGTDELSRDVAWWLGATVGDANYTDRKEGQIHFSNIDEALRSEFIRIGGILGGRVATRRDERGCHMCSLPLRLRLEMWGLDYVLAPEKRVPDVVWRSGPSAWGSFIQGLFDTDGHISSGPVVFCTASIRLADEVQHMLLALGIATSRGDYMQGSGRYAGSLYYQLRVNAEQLDRFKALVGFRSPAKAAALKASNPNRHCLKFDGTDEVSAIDDVGHVGNVMDVELETIHQLSFNGIVGHNSQGLTLEKVRVHLKKCFADGQAYVALSRAKTLEGLFIADISGNSIRANPAALEFYRRCAA